jgi:hypothetical protein
MFEIVYVIWRGARRPIEAHVHVGKIEIATFPAWILT